MFEPFLTGRLQGLAGEYPVWSDQPVRAQDVPGAIDRAYHEAATRRGPALVVVPMDDWLQPADEDREDASPGRVVRAAGVDPAAVDELAAFLEGATAPALVVGAGTDGEEAWAALVELAERLVAPVFQESFAARAGFPQDHRLFAGFLPADRPRLRELLAPYDAVLVLGAPVFRQSPYAPGRLTEDGTRIAVVGDEPDEVHRSPAELAVLAPPAAVARELARRVPQRDAEPPAPFAAPPAPEPPAPGEPLTGEPRARGARRARSPRTRSSSRRRPSTGRSSTRACRRDGRSASSARRWAGSGSPSPARRACGWRCRSARWWRSSATARRSTGSRGSGAPCRRAPASCT